LHYEKFQDGTVKCIEDEIPFELPEGWAWTRLGGIGNWQSGATPSRHHLEYYGGSIPWLKTGDLNDGFINSVSEYITKEGFNNSSVVLNPVGSVLIAMYGATIGKLGITNIEVTTNQACCACLPIIIINHYLFYFLMYQKKYFIEKAVGGAQPNISKEKIVATLFPVPPLREQKELVSMINKLISKIDSIASCKNEIENIIAITKSRILDLAIRGKLVPQDPNDEPASVLLERIRAEKEELIKQGKIKRDKKKSVIFKGEDNSYYEKIGSEVRCIDEEILLDIPDTWEWIRLENCCSKEIRRGKSPKYIDKSGTLVFAQKCNTKYNGIDIGLALNLDESTLGRYPINEYMQDGDIVVNSTGTGTLGRVGFYRTSDNHIGLPIVPDSHITIIRGFSCIQAFYLYTFMKANQGALEKKGEGSTNQKELKPLTLKEMLVPLPPISEQKRIETAVSAAFSLITLIERGLS
jgi:type I restriction enzyme, S subunit